MNKNKFPNEPAPGQLDQLGPVLRRVIGIQDDYAERIAREDAKHLRYTLALGDRLATDLETTGAFTEDFFAWDDSPSILNTGRLAVERAAGLTEGTLLALAEDNPSVIRLERKQGVGMGVGSFWSFDCLAKGPRGYGFARDKTVPLGNVYRWSDGNFMVVLVQTTGVSTGRIGAVSRGVIIAQKIMPDDALLADRLGKLAENAAIRVRGEDIMMRRPRDETL